MVRASRDTSPCIDSQTNQGFEWQRTQERYVGFHLTDTINIKVETLSQRWRQSQRHDAYCISNPTGVVLSAKSNGIRSTFAGVLP